MTCDRRVLPAGSRIDRTALRDGWTLRRFVQEARGTPRGALLWLGGRGDILEKYLEAFDHWAARGWHVTSVDWRGQGGSGRLLSDAAVGHIGDFGTWIEDLADVAGAWRKDVQGPFVLAGHSMGGHLLLRALVERRVTADKAVLVAPMLGFDTPGLPFRAARALSAVLGRISPQRRAWPDNERPSAPGASRQALLTRCDARYADELWWKSADPQLALGPPSWGWVAASYRSVARLRRPGVLEAVDTPVLLLGSEGDRLVSAEAIRTAAARLPHAQLHMYGREVPHELLRDIDETRLHALTLIDEFLA